MNTKKKIEVLAPCGSFEALEAAVFSGADAVYLGGDKFGARAYASNFNQEELVRALKFVHLHGKKLYLTVNTLLKESEMRELYEYLRMPYEYGLDAVIVQDFGVASYVKKNFPEMDLHISTQATVTGRFSAEFAKSMGASRIVPARELSFKEIKDIKDATGLEVEVFVHGALCYCYSGQCLLSSMIGGRSGNRGRCAQPCRLPYQAFDENGMISNEKESYLLSPKDLYGLEHLEQLILAGVDSLKIEGRMKKPEYVALVTSKYRKYVDQFEKTGKIHVLDEDKQELMDIYNRGGFTDGYFENYNGRNMMSMEVPNHIGVYVGSIEKMNKNQIGFRPQVKIEKQDVLTIKAKKKEVTLTSPVAVEAADFLWLNAMNLKELRVGDKIYRTRNNMLVEKINTIREKYQKNQCSAKVSFLSGNPAVFELEYHSFKIRLEDFIVEKANRLPTSKEEVLDLIKKTGNLNFEFSNIELELSEDAFIPKKFVKQLRNQAILALEQEIEESNKRCLPKQNVLYEKENQISEEKGNLTVEEKVLSVKVRTKEQLETIIFIDEIKKVYVSYELVLRNKEWFKEIKTKVRNKAWYLVLPEIIRKKDLPLLDELLDFMDEFEGVLVENLEEIGYLLNKNYKKKIVYGAFCYQYNKLSLKYHKDIFEDTLSTFPYELNKQEAKDLPGQEYEMVVYGLLPLMKSVQCVKKNTKGCRKIPEELYLKDRKNEKMLVLPMCELCYNLIFNSKPIMLLDQGEYFAQNKITKYRLEFINESPKQVKEIVNNAIQGLLYDKKIDFKGEYTRGHFNRGVE